MAFMDWPFDGISVGYAWNWGIEPLGDSRIRFCYGRGFEAGLQNETAAQSTIPILPDSAGIS